MLLKMLTRNHRSKSQLNKIYPISLATVAATVATVIITISNSTLTFRKLTQQYYFLVSCPRDQIVQIGKQDLRNSLLFDFDCGLIELLTLILLFADEGPCAL